MSFLIDRLPHKRLLRGARAADADAEITGFTSEGGGALVGALKIEDAVRMLSDGTAPVFEITNVADLVNRSDDLVDGKDIEATINWSKFPNIAPPFTTYWMEWAAPAALTTRRFLIERIGVWIQRVAGPDDEYRLGFAAFIGERSGEPIPIGRGELAISVATGAVIGEVTPFRLHEAGFDTFHPPGHDEPSDDIVQEELGMLAARGITEPAEVRAAMEDRYQELGEKVDRLHAELMDKWAKVFRIAVYPNVLMAHSLLACKNVSTDVHHRPAKVIKARQKKGKPAVVRFETLKIRPTGGARASGGSHDLGGGERAMHLVRGHTKTFTAERPLLGKHVGTYWWSPALRGNEEAGVVVKDYKIEP